MCQRSVIRLLLCLFIFVAFSKPDNLEGNGEEGFHETSLENQFSTVEDTTNEELEIVTESIEIGTFKPIVVDGDTLRNDTKVFRPSLHLGEIDEPFKNPLGNPFNNVQQIKFENFVNVDSSGFQNFQDSHAAKESEKIKFHDYQDEFRYHIFKTQESQTPSLPSAQSSRSRPEDLGKAAVEQLILDGSAKSTLDEQIPEFSVLGKPSKFQNGLQEHSFDYQARSPYISGYYYTNDYNGYQPTLYETTVGSVESAGNVETAQKPEDEVLYLQHEIYTRTRKFPYQYYRPDAHQVVDIHEETPMKTYPRRRISPWRKIIHLIGAFLPLGLLLATLTPNVVKIDNATQPSIVLSKLRVVDLPVEHKLARHVDDSTDLCEERTICESILTGGEPRSNVLRRVLWNLVERTSDETAKRNDLEEVFRGVRNRNCSMVHC